jgi:hypothetical protein
MSRRVLKVFVLGALVVIVFAAVVSSASAANWISNGARSFSMTAGQTFWIIHSPAGAGVSCTNAGTANGALKATPTSPAIPSTSAWLGAATFTPTFSTCGSTGFSWTWTCAPGTNLNAISFASPVITVGLSAINCKIAVPSQGCGTVASGTVSTVGITITGSVTGTFTNSAQKLVVFSNGSNQNLTAAATASCDGITGFSGGGVARATFGSTSAGTGNVTYTVTGSPSIWTS